LATKRAADRTANPMYDAMTAVILCTAAAEVGVNEIYHWFGYNGQRGPFNVTPHRLPNNFDPLELRMKFWLLPMVARHRSFDRGTEPWQSFDALVQLRNFCLHF